MGSPYFIFSASTILLISSSASSVMYGYLFFNRSISTAISSSSKGMSSIDAVSVTGSDAASDVEGEPSSLFFPLPPHPAVIAVTN
ncbi:MAG: hypothetical protein K0R28_448 [Paenibacillus sp.]|jgi:hypothetical protein|nr:hypothetical protein [Paenibacillus sp.]